MKLRAIIYGIHEFDEIPDDYMNKTEEGILTAQRLIAKDDPISFVYPDNVHVVIEPIDQRSELTKMILAQGEKK